MKWFFQKNVHLIVLQSRAVFGIGPTPRFCSFIEKSTEAEIDKSIQDAKNLEKKPKRKEICRPKCLNLFNLKYVIVTSTNVQSF